MRIAIIGGGITGLTAGYRLSRNGHNVTIFEKNNFLGGLSATFKEKGWQWSLEQFYHHIFTNDESFLELISELKLRDKLFFTRPQTSIYYNGQMSQFDTPLSLLRFPHLSALDKIRTGLVTLYLKVNPSWKLLEKQTAVSWLKKYYGQKPYEILWQPLLKSKFGIEAENVSMAWFWARIKKRSPRLGYLEGGFQILLEKLVEKIKENGSKILLNHEVKNLNDIYYCSDFEKVIITTPSQIFLKEIKLPEMFGAINLILVLKEKFLTDNTYWLNINETNFPFVAVVEHTNFIDKKYYGGNHLLYIGGYYPQGHQYFKTTKEEILKEFLPYLRKINPKFNFKFEILNLKLASNLYAQPIIPVNYSKLIPPFKTQIPNVFLANMQQVYPWDRGINYAVELGEKIAYEVCKI